MSLLTPEVHDVATAGLPSVFADVDGHELRPAPIRPEWIIEGTPIARAHVRKHYVDRFVPRDPLSRAARVLRRLSQRLRRAATR